MKLLHPHRISQISTLLCGLCCCAVASAETKDAFMLWEAARLVPQPEMTAMLQTNEVVQEAYAELQLQERLAAEAIQRGLTEKLAVRHQLEVARRAILIGALAEEVQKQASPPGEEEVRAIYESDPALFTMPDRYLLDVIQIDPTDIAAMYAARSLHEELSVSDDRLFAVPGQTIVTQAEGAWVTQPNVATSIWEQLPTIQPGSTRFFELETGAFLLRRGAFFPAEQMTYEQAHDIIYQQLYLRNQEQHWQEYLESFK